MRLPCFSKTEWALLLCSIIAIIVLSGCTWPWSRGSLLAGPHGTSGISRGPGSVLADLAIWSTWAAGVGLLCCGIGAVFLPNKLGVAKVAVGCVAALLVAGILHWIAAHWAVLMGLCAIVLLLGGGAYAYLHRRQIERASGVDLDRDGRIG